MTFQVPGNGPSSLTQKDTPQPTGRKERWIHIFALKCRRIERGRKKKRRRERIRFQKRGKMERSVEREKMREAEPVRETIRMGRDRERDRK